MRFIFGCFITAFLAGMHSFSFAQTAYAVNGTVSTDNSSSAEGATVTLLRFPDSTVVKSTICTRAGRFGFLNIKPGSYMVLAHKVGYKRIYTAPYRVIQGDVHINDIVLPFITNQLKEVLVTDKRDYIEVKPDKTILNVDRSILAAGNSAMDVLETAPGVRIIGNQVLLKGGQKALIAINGKPVGQLNDDQLAELLKSYQSNMISQIELIENPSAKYDAAGGGGVINIILKKSKETGFKANLTESAAAGQDYKFITGLNFNYRTPKLNLFGSYSFTGSKTPRMLDVDRVIGPVDIDESYQSTSYLKNNSFNLGADYSLTAKQTIGVLFYGYHNGLGIDKGNVTAIANNVQTDSIVTEQSHIDRSITNLNYNLNYKGSFGKNDNTTVAADIDYSTYRRSSAELLQNDFLDVTGMPYMDPVFYLDNSPSSINVRSEKIDVSQALSKTGTLSAGLKNNQVNSNNTIDFESRADSVPQFTPVPALTDHFLYKERINAAYVDYSDKFNKTSLMLGLRGEKTNSFSESLNPNKTILRSYFDFFPNIELTQEIDENNKYSVNYNRRIMRPNYQDLNPFVAYIDQYSYSTGNTLLRPEYISTYGVSDLYKDRYKFALSMVVTKDFFVPVFLQNDSSKVYTTTTDNIGTRYEYEAEFNVPVDITKWWKLNLNFYGAYERFVYFAENTGTKTSQDFEIQATQNFSITSGLKAEVYTSWESPTYYGIKQYNAQFISRAGISQSVLHNEGVIRLTVSDIFNSDLYRYTSHYANLDLTGREKSGSRFITATFTYRFGKQSVKAGGRRVGGNYDEQKRLSGSANEN